MTDTSPKLTLAQQIDKICDRFEADWTGGRQPRIEDFLGDSQEPGRSALLQALVQVEAELLRSAGSPPQAILYAARFPDHTAIVREALAGNSVRSRHPKSSSPDVAQRSPNVTQSLRTGEIDTSRSGKPSAAPSPVAMPQQISRFKVLEVLGEGGFGAVYRAHDPQLDRDVAIKVPRSGNFQSSEDRQRFLREARASATLSHASICPVYEIGEADGSLYIVMAYIEGKPLSKLIEAGKPIPERQAISAVRKLALALQEAHDKGVVHRDIKPANIMVNRKGEPVVMDFGLARRTIAGDVQLTQTGAIMGTPAYMSPEQARGDGKHIGPAADIYSLGVILYELLCGRRPFTGTLTEVLGQILHVAPDSPSQHRPGLAPRLDEICLKAIAKQESDRYASMHDFAEALAGYLRASDPRVVGTERHAATDAPRSGVQSGGETFHSVDSAPEVSGLISPPNRPIPIKTVPTAEGTTHLARMIGGLQSELRAHASRQRFPWWLGLIGAGFLGVFLLLGIMFFYRTPTATVLINIDVDLKDAALRFVLDSKDVPAELLAVPMELAVGTHELLVWRGDKLERKFQFVVKGGVKPEIAIKDETPNPSQPPVPVGNVPRSTAIILSPPATFKTAEVLLLGDGHMERWETDGRAARDRLFAGISVWNDGKGGRAAAGLLRQLGPQFLPNVQPRVVIVQVGIAALQDLEVPIVSQDFENIIAGLQQRFPQVPLVLTSVLPADHHLGIRDKAKQLNASIARFANGPNVHWVDLEPIFVDQAENMRRDLIEGGLKLTPLGYERWADALQPLVQQLRVQSPGMSLSGNAPPLAKTPFDAKQARAHQEAWAKYLGTTVETANSIGMTMILIPPGEFLMGSTDEQVEAALKVANEISADEAGKRRIQNAERPQHKVIITRPLLMSATEVTIGQFKKFVESSKYVTEAEKYGFGDHSSKVLDNNITADKKQKNWRTPGYAVTDDSPVAQITWNDAVAYCQWLSTQEKGVYRLPTEAEWEYACRAGTTTQYSFGDDRQQLEQYGWYNKNGGGKSYPVGTKRPNGFGLFDMHGNVQEWCGDFYDEKWYAASPSSDPNGPAAGSNRVIRGGYWNLNASTCRSASRSQLIPSNRISLNGFRVVRVLDVPPAASTPPVVQAAANSPPLAQAPFDAKQARAHQEAWAKYLGTTVETANSIGTKMILIPPGEFMMGSTDEEVDAALQASVEFKKDPAMKGGYLDSEHPQHRVVLSKPFSMGATEVTVGQFRKFVNATKYLTEQERDLNAKPDTKDKTTWRDPGYKISEELPVTVVTWNDAAAFCNWLSEQEKLPGCYQFDGTTWNLTSAAGYRLPTEAEWEFSCRAGTTTQFWFGDNLTLLEQYEWFNRNSDNRPHDVGTKPTNPFGLHDVYGNAREWCQDWFGHGYYESSLFRDPPGPATPSRRVIRGGSWNEVAFVCRGAHRQNRYLLVDRGYFGSFNGFRVARTIDASSLDLSAKAVHGAPSPAKIPFDAKQARAHQEAWATHLGTAVETANSIGTKMILIPPGEFMMGSSDEQIDAAHQVIVAEEPNISPATKEAVLHVLRAEQPQHAVVLTKPCLMGATEVTIGQFRNFVAGANYITQQERELRENPALMDKKTWREPGYATDDQAPVAMVSWNDTAAFCNWLSKQERLDPCYQQDGNGDWHASPSARGYRLATEAEWEFACRGGTSTPYSCGESELRQHAWFDKNASNGPRAVGTKLPNAFRLHDMHGNLYEWCHDWMDGSYYAKSPRNDPTGPATGTNHVLRGGGYSGPPSSVRSAYRTNRYMNATRLHLYGFRVARTLDIAATVAAQPAAAVNPDRRAAEWVLELGGALFVTVDGKQVRIPSKAALPQSPYQVSQINLADRQGISDDGLQNVANLSGLSYLVLNATGVTNRGIVYLQGLSNLEYLNLYNLPITDQGLQPVLGLKNLNWLGLHGTRVTDVGVAGLVNFIQLKTLELDGTKISDVSVEHLKNLRKLELVNLSRTNVTPEGLRKLQVALPNCKILPAPPASAQTP